MIKRTKTLTTGRHAWFHSLSDAGQKAYLDEHPGSKIKRRASESGLLSGIKSLFKKPSYHKHLKEIESHRNLAHHHAKKAAHYRRYAGAHANRVKMEHHEAMSNHHRSQAVQKHNDLIRNNGDYRQHTLKKLIKRRGF